MRKPAILIALALLVPAAVGAAANAAGSTEPARVYASPAYDADRNRIFDDLDRHLAGTPAGTPVDVIIVFTGASLEEGKAALRRAVGDVDVPYDYPTLPGVSLALTAEQVKRVATLDVVRQVELVVEGTPELASSTHYIGARHAWSDLGVTGDADGNPDVFTAADATIAVLDTGLNANHVDFSNGKLIAWHDTVLGRTTPYDSGDHGTHVASIATGLGIADPEHKGVAPGASLVLVRIANKAHAAAAVEWVMANKDVHGIDVMTMSFGFGIGRDGTDSLSMLFDEAFEAGIVTVKSTGNSGPNHSTMTIPGDAHHILAVGSLVDPGELGWHLSTFSSRGPTTDGRIKPDVSAPGQGISAAYARSTTGYVSKSGTSMAAPHVAGVAALVKSANPALTAAEIRQIIVDTAQDRGFPGPDNDYGAGLVDAYAAVERARGGNGTNPVTQPSVVSLVAPDPVPGAWLVEVDEGATRLSFTVLSEVQGTTGNFNLVVVKPNGAPVFASNFGSRHLNYAVPNPAPGTYVVGVTGGHQDDLVVDMSTHFPDDPSPLHGFGTSTPFGFLVGPAGQ